ncbi:hypothetical protein [Duganella violaceipulchra]|uniref:Pilus assembly protein PilO n=1 Tax=Duganella violaceipulchra TaxID=2849652 RepID=A0AA41L3H4_9BURK|nr:hypothetical protein [Duganella violaceicalia]MBV6323968.1 hypothetical protein [Duganella violaceicalia]MCP2011050.1 hypothetical protein [Duganella violaceicalia]
MSDSGGAGGSWTITLRELAWRAGGGARAWHQRLGWSGLVVLVALALAAAALAIEREQRRAGAVLRRQLAVPSAAAAVPAQDRERQALAAFERQLLPYEEIPVVVQELMVMAERRGVTLARGEYRLQPDVPGGFLRYRIRLPLKGKMSVVYGFIQDALQAQPALALERVQFKRERSDALEVEAGSEWALLVRRPAHGEVAP